MSAEAVVSREPRIPVSLRLPPQLVREVNEYAQSQRISKTDAYVRFLQLGIEGSSPSSESQMSELVRQVQEIYRAVVVPSESLTFEQVKQAISDASGEYPAIRQAYVFGSFARGVQTKDSDIDIRLIVDSKMHFNLHDLEHFAKRVEQATGRQTDVITARTIKNERLAETIDREKVLVYERKED